MGYYNTATGSYALGSNKTGYYNTANGVQSLYANTTGQQNTAIGFNTLHFNTTGNYNTSSGVQSLYANTTGYSNAATGYSALYANTTGNYNSAHGASSLYSNKTGLNNTASGAFALYANTTGSLNTAMGYNALYSNTIGGGNIALGYQAGYNLTTGGNNIVIGNAGVAGESGAIRIGKASAHTSAYIAGINGATVSGGVAVYINSKGQLGTMTSSRRFKSDIKSMGSASDKLLQLRPVVFRYKAPDEAGARPIQYGLIAEETAKVFPELVQCDRFGKPFTIYYHLLTPILLNQVQKEHAKNEAQQAEIAALRESLQKQARELALMRKSQREQEKLLAKLAAYIQKPSPASSQKVGFIQH
jgi:hypothetical protein